MLLSYNPGSGIPAHAHICGISYMIVAAVLVAVAADVVDCQKALASEAQAATEGRGQQS